MKTLNQNLLLGALFGFLGGLLCLTGCRMGGEAFGVSSEEVEEVDDGSEDEPCSLASNWQTVDEFTLDVGEVSRASSIYVSSQGTVYVSGRAVLPADLQEAIVRRSIDGGETWQTVVRQDSGTNHIQGRSVLESAAGTIFHLFYEIAAPTLAWVNRSTDNGTSFTDDFSVGNGAQHYDLSESSTGDLVTVGGSVAGPTIRCFEVLRSANQGQGWTLAQNLCDANSKYFYDSGFDTDDTLWMAGEIDNLWDVRSSADLGQNLSANLDAFQLGGSGNSEAHGVATDSQDRIFVAGWGVDASREWIVRMSDDGGATWSTSDNFTLDPTRNTQATAIAVGANDQIAAVGQSRDNSGVRHWVVRLSENSGQSWSELDRYQPTVGNPAEASSVAFSPNGDIYVAGYAQVVGGIDKWIVRKLACE